MPYQYSPKITTFYQTKAKNELNENPQEIDGKISELRAMVNSNKALHIDTSDNFLLKFLRHRKWNVKNAYERIIHYFKVKHSHKEIFGKTLLPSNFKHIYEAGLINMAPSYDKDGCGIIIYRPGKLDLALPITDLLRALIIFVEHLLNDEIIQIAGIKFIVDFSDMTMSHIPKFSPYYFQTVKQIMMSSMPMRIRKICILYGGLIFNTIFKVISFMMAEKMKQRLINCESDVGKMHEFVCPKNESGVFDTSILPNEELFGSKDSKYSLPRQEYIAELLMTDAKFKILNEYYIEEFENISQRTANDKNPYQVSGKFTKLDD